MVRVVVLKILANEHSHDFLRQDDHMRKLLGLGLFTGIGVLIYNMAQGAFARTAQPAPAGGTLGAVRDAGPEELHGIEAKDWDMVDQQSDESFPASDAPGNY